jgi:hypothetical protein
MDALLSAQHVLEMFRRNRLRLMSRIIACKRTG